ncbi:TPA: hypothetical protein HA241_03415 [Candidatus Woesearchaeota archaeon]|nr:hypothetical protein [Candidatus Woesearchaeota archaeon]
MISQELINELKIIIREDYGVELQPAVVSDIAYTLVGFFESLAKVAYETGIIIPTPENPITDLKQKLRGGDEA